MPWFGGEPFPSQYTVTRELWEQPFDTDVPITPYVGSGLHEAIDLGVAHASMHNVAGRVPKIRPHVRYCHKPSSNKALDSLNPVGEMIKDVSNRCFVFGKAIIALAPRLQALGAIIISHTNEPTLSLLAIWIQLDSARSPSDHG